MPVPPNVRKKRANTMKRVNTSTTNEFGFEIPSSNWRNYELSVMAHAPIYNMTTGYMFNENKDKMIAKKKMRNAQNAYMKRRATMSTSATKTKTNTNTNGTRRTLFGGKKSLTRTRKHSRG